MVGIEKCQAFAVYPAMEAAFRRQYGSRILAGGSELLSQLPIPVIVYQGP
jgi:hypothetical protein